MGLYGIHSGFISGGRFFQVWSFYMERKNEHQGWWSYLYAILWNHLCAILGQLRNSLIRVGNQLYSRYLLDMRDHGLPKVQLKGRQSFLCLEEWRKDQLMWIPSFAIFRKIFELVDWIVTHTSLESISEIFWSIFSTFWNGEKINCCQFTFLQFLWRFYSW